MSHPGVMGRAPLQHRIRADLRQQPRLDPHARAIGQEENGPRGRMRRGSDARCPLTGC
jgi:hypothetical protein